MEKSFWFKEFDINHLLPERWAEDIIDVTKTNAKDKNLIPTSVTSRESNEVAAIKVSTVGGKIIAENLPWLRKMYESVFLEIGKSCVDEEVFIANDDRYALNLNYQYGINMRYECHVDSNPLEGLLYVTTHPEGTGGELIVGLNKLAKSVEEVDKDCQKIYPKSGNLIFFDAREFPHYVAHLKNENDFRIVVAMNFYTPSCPESSRPDDLNTHLGIQ